MNRSIRSFLANLAISACIGLTVGVVVLYPRGLATSPAHLLLASAAIGVIIGTLARATVLLFFRYTGKNLFVGYSLLFLITGSLTLAAAYPLEWTAKLMMLAVVQPLALLTMYFNIRYFHRLNDGLKRKQASLAQKPPDDRP
jgi:hypothetical protein